MASCIYCGHEAAYVGLFRVEGCTNPRCRAHEVVGSSGGGPNAAVEPIYARLSADERLGELVIDENVMDSIKQMLMSPRHNGVVPGMEQKAAGQYCDTIRRVITNHREIHSLWFDGRSSPFDYYLPTLFFVVEDGWQWPTTPDFNFLANGHAHCKFGVVSHRMKVVYVYDDKYVPDGIKIVGSWEEP